MTTPSGKRRHRADIYEPSGELDGRGQVRSFSLYLEKVPCSVDDLAGKEYEIARSLYADAKLKVGMYGDPKKPINTTHRLTVNKTRTLQVGYVKDLNQNGVELELYCSEVR